MDERKVFLRLKQGSLGAAELVLCDYFPNEKGKTEYQKRPIAIDGNTFRTAYFSDEEVGPANEIAFTDCMNLVRALETSKIGYSPVYTVYKNRIGGLFVVKCLLQKWGRVTFYLKPKEADYPYISRYCQPLKPFCANYEE
jgi:hypothetical protein